MWPVATYGCESWTLRKAEEKKISAFENKCARRILQIPWTAKMTNEAVWAKLGVKPELLNQVKTRKLSYFGHVLRQEKASIEQTIMTGLTPGTRRRGRPATAWIDNVTEWTQLKGSGLLSTVRDRKSWRSLIHHCGQPSSMKKA